MASAGSARFSFTRQFSITAVASLLIAGVLASTPIDSAEADEYSRPKSAGNKNTSKGAASVLAVALADAKKSDKPVEVESLRSATESVFANADGTVTSTQAAAPVHVKSADGEWVDIDPTLASQDGRLAAKAVEHDVTFSSDGSGDLAKLNLGEGRSLALTYLGDLGTAETRGGVATYATSAPSETGAAESNEPSDDPAPSSSPSDDPQTAAAADDAEGPSPDAVRVAMTGGGFASHVVLDSAPQSAPTYRFRLQTDGLRAELDGQTVKLLDGSDVVAQTRPLQMWDAKVDRGGDPVNTALVDASLTADGPGAYVLELRPSLEWLSDAAREYPVTVDPDFIAVVKREGDTWFFSGQASNDSQGESSRLVVGSMDGSRKFRALSTYSRQRLLGRAVRSATLRMDQYYDGSGTGACTMNIDAMTTGDDKGLIYWGNQPEHSTDAQWRSTKLTDGATSCANGVLNFDVSAIVSAWAGDINGAVATGSVRGRQGLFMTAFDELDQAQQKRYCSLNWDASVAYCNTAARIPQLSVTFEPQLGAQSWYSTTDHTLNDRSSIRVNNKNGNVIVQASDANVAGVGVDLSVSRTYNSQSAAIGSMGRGWTLGVGPDVFLEKKSEFRYDYHTPDGTVLGSFARKSSNPTDADYNKFATPTGGVRADLTQSGSMFKLKFRKDRITYEFKDNTPDDNAYLTAIEDRSDNRVEMNYSGTTSTNKPKMTSITGSGQTLNITYGSGAAANYVSRIEQNITLNNGFKNTVTRGWTYTYNDAGYLTQYQDPKGVGTKYAYADVTGPTDVLSTIEGAVNDSGRAPLTKVAYANKAGLELNQAVKVSYKYGAGDNDFYDYTYDYRTGASQRPSRCDGHGSEFTIVTDPNNHDTTYCFDSRDDDIERDKTWVYNALGDLRSADYSADNGPMNVTDPSGQGVTGGSTAATYGSQALSDQLLSVSEPKGARDAALTTFAYGTSGSNGGSYQPTAIRNTTGNCSRYEYDDRGRVTDAYTGITATSAAKDFCGSGGRRFHREYNDNGTVSESWDANSGSSPSAGDKTIYTYWKSDDADYMPGTSGRLKSIRKPGGDCSATVAAGRSLCTSYAYDSAARVSSMRDGNGIVTNYETDVMDRTGAVFFNGASSCNIPGSDCLVYKYDNEGNLNFRSESRFDGTRFHYDQLNRQIESSADTGLLLPRDIVSSAYDGTGNLITYRQSVYNEVDTVSYTYDAANQLKTVTDNSGTINMSVNNDGRTTAVTFPKPAGSDGMKVNYDFSASGKPKTLKINKQTSGTISTTTYDYTLSLFDGLLEVETGRMQGRTVTGALSGINVKLAYTYDNSDRLTRATDSNNGGTSYEYSYDGVGNVEKEQAGSTTKYYGYNRAGELCWQGPNAANDDKLKQKCGAAPSGNTALTRDNNGNNTGTSADPITYNDRQQVAKIGGAAMTYRDLGNDIRATTTGGYRLTSGPMGITAIRTGQSNTFYTRDPQGSILNSRTGNTVRNYVTDYNGSTIAMFSPVGTAVGSYKYAPYGATKVNSESGGGAAAENRFRYVGGYQDVTAAGDDGAYKLGARYYDANHFTQSDPITAGGGSYTYADSDPINSSDPSGLTPCNPSYSGSCAPPCGNYYLCPVAIPGYVPPPDPTNVQQACLLTIAFVGGLFFGPSEGKLAADATIEEIERQAKRRLARKFFGSGEFAGSIATGVKCLRGNPALK